MSQIPEGYAEKQINFTEVIESGAGVRSTKSWVIPGKITQVMFSFPPGCNGLVDARLEKNGDRFYPLSGWLTLDNATPVYYVEADYYRREPLTFVAQNRDEGYDHTITCTVVIRFKKPDWWG